MTLDNIVKRVETDRAPKPGGHYSQGCANNNLLFVSGSSIYPGWRSTGGFLEASSSRRNWPLAISWRS